MSNVPLPDDVLPAGSVHSNSWALTYNNPTHSIEDFFDAAKMHTLAGQLEIGEESGTLHYQFCVKYKRGVRKAAVIAQFPGCHVSAMYAASSFERLLKYCTKEATRVPHDHARLTNSPAAAGHIDIEATPVSVFLGKRVTKGKRNDLQAVADMIKSGKRKLDVLNAYPLQFIRYHRGISEAMGVRNAALAPAWRSVEVLIFCGETGTGKSRYARTIDPNLFELNTSGSTVWWDGYDTQETLLLDDFYGGVKWGTLLTMLDGYPQRRPVKGGFCHPSYKRVIITSNKQYDDWYTSQVTGQGAPALLRRISEIVQFPKECDPEDPAEFARVSYPCTEHKCGERGHAQKDLTQPTITGFPRIN